MFFDKDVKFVSPITGQCVELSEVPDEMFSQKMMGDGVAIIPSEGVVVAPIDGVITTLFHTLHAVGITTKKGVEILIHVGIDTVNLNGECFEGFVKEGDKVKKGDTLVKFDIAGIEKAGYKVITPFIVLSPDTHKELKTFANKNVKAGQDEVIIVTTN